jgi:hypothetical protein
MTNNEFVAAYNIAHYNITSHMTTELWFPHYPLRGTPVIRLVISALEEQIDE